MSKRSAPRGVPQRPGPGNPQGALQALQQKMAETQEALANETVQVSAGGGAVTVVMTGQQKVQSITISPDVLSAGDVDMLQDLVVAAVNDAIDKSQELAAQRMSSITGGLGIPGLM